MDPQGSGSYLQYRSRALYDPDGVRRPFVLAHSANLRLRIESLEDGHDARVILEVGDEHLDVLAGALLSNLSDESYGSLKFIGDQFERFLDGVERDALGDAAR